MKYIVVGIISLLFLSANAQTDTTLKQQNFNTTINCAYIDDNTLACYSPEIDNNEDGVIDAEEWNNADVRNRGIIELDQSPDESDVFDPDGEYEYDGLYNYDNAEGRKNDYDLLDDEEDGAFE